MKPHHPFDLYAAQYDGHFTHSIIGRLQREQVWKYLKKWINPGMEILEINCGTGEDAIELARRGCNVLATDQSEKMIEVASRKAENLEPHQKVLFFRSGFLELTEYLKGRRFDLVFSNFGGLNCISPDETMEFSEKIYDIVHPHGHLFLVYMTKYCLWEKWYFQYQGKVDKANRRNGSPFMANLGNELLPVWYYSQKELKMLYGPWFIKEASAPVGLVVPPTYMESYFAKKQHLLKKMNDADQFLRFPALAEFADHMVMIFRKTVY